MKPAVARILVINGHPDPSPERLCAALARRYVEAAIEAGHEVRQVTLGQMDVPMLTTMAEFEAPPGEAIRAIQSDLLWSSHLLLVFPLWLGTAPAKLKALLEQLMRQSFGFETGPQGMTPRLKGRTARVVVTMGMPALIFRLYFGAHGVLGLEKGILGLAGLGPIRRLLLGGVASASPAQRLNWLDRMARLGARGR
jgi:putative NADPH-quinone reductase